MPKYINLKLTILIVLLLLPVGINPDMVAASAIIGNEQTNVDYPRLFNQQGRDAQQLNSSAPGEPEDQYPIMKPSREQRQKWIEKYNKAPRVTINDTLKRRLEASPGASIDLSSYSPWNSSNMPQRNQGSCGNCWAWAGTGVMEVAHSYSNSISDRLSIQYLNSNYNNGVGVDWACCGGWLDDLTGFYQSKGRAIRWDNFNALYQDGSRTCSTGSGVIPPNIDTIPYYNISSITPVTIPTQGVAQSTAIANIKNVLNQDKAVFFAFFLPDADWTNFRSFWRDQLETFIWDFPDISGKTQDGGHAVLCIGYNDSVPQPYWIMMNSWGTRPDRPNGLFRVLMDMDYSCTYIDQGNHYSFYWQTLDITYGNSGNLVTQETGQLIGAEATDTPNASNVDNYFILSKFAATGTGNATQFKINCSGAGNVKVAIYSDNAGQPGNLLNAVNTNTPVVAGWNTITFPSTALTSGTNYWLAFNSDSPIVGARRAASGNRRYVAATFSTFNFPASAGALATDTSFYDLAAGWRIMAAPTITNAVGATNITGTAATLNGNLTYDGGSSSTVTVYWGNVDGVTNPASWANTVSLGATPVGLFSTNISSLTNGITYYYRSSATNDIGTSWASSSASFVALNPLVGASAADTPNASNTSNYFILSRFTANSTANMTQFKINCSGAGNVKVAIYSDNAGQPGNLLNSINTSTPVVAGWNTITFPSTALTSGTNYWLAFNSDSTIVGAKSGVGNRRYMAATFSTFNCPGSVGALAADTTYYDLEAGWGAVIPSSPPAAPTLLSPGTAITFKWNPATWATNYRLQVNTQADFNGTSVFNAEVGDNTSREVTGFSLGTTYFWRVQAGNSYGWSGWSTTRNVVAN
jgi:hypothetical protein